MAFKDIYSLMWQRILHMVPHFHPQKTPYSIWIHPPSPTVFTPNNILVYQDKFRIACRTQFNPYPIILTNFLIKNFAKIFASL